MVDHWATTWELAANSNDGLAEKFKSPHTLSTWLRSTEDYLSAARHMNLIIRCTPGVNPMAHDVFISYSTKDKVVADTIVAALEKNHIRCWYAPRDIKPGADWGEEIAKAINVSSVFLLIFSSSANQSQRVLDELNLAILREVVILPFRIEKLDPSGAMLLHLSSRHWLDAFVPSWEKHLDNLVVSVSSNLEKGDRTAAVDFARNFDQSSKPGKRRTRLFGIAAAVLVVAFAAIFGIPKLLNQLENTSAALALSNASLTPTAPAPDIGSPTPEEIVSPTSIIVSSPTPDIPALGSAENPLVWMYVPPFQADFNDVNTASDEIAKEIINLNPGLSLKMIPVPDEPTLVEALCDGEAHIGSLTPVAFMAASDRDCAEAKLIWSAYGDINFGGMIVTRADSGVTEISQLEDKPLCIPSYSSFSGWLLPSMEIKASAGRDLDSFFSEIIETGDHLTAIEEVYNGQCIAGTAFYDARQLVDLPGVEDRVIILSTTTTVPNSNISFSRSINPELSQKLMNYFLNSSESENLILLSGLSDASETIKLIEINDYYYKEIRDLFQRAGENPADYYYFWTQNSE